MEKRPAILNVIDEILEIQVNVSEKLQDYAHLNTVIKAFNEIYRELDEIFHTFELHSLKSQLEEVFNSITSYWTENITIPLNGFLNSFSDKVNLDGLHIKLLVFVC
jgi:hypothetical protein